MAGLCWNPYDAKLAADPWPAFNRLREEAPPHYNESHDFYAVSRYADVERTLANTQVFSSARGVILERIKANIELPPGTVIMEDPPAHNIRCQLLARIFSPRRIAALGEPIRRYATGCLDPLVGESRFDLIAALGREMPMRVIGMLLGVPEEGMTAVREQSDSFLNTTDGGKIDASKSFAGTGLPADDGALPK
jgi:cytochrome P450